MEKTAYTISGKEITAYIPKEPKASNLEAIYDVCNEIFADYSECFYASNEIKAMKKDPSNRFLKKGAEQ